MKLKPVTKVDKRNKTPSKNMTLLLLLTFYLAKTENETKKSPAQLSHYCFE